MATIDKAKNSTQQAKGKVKEAAGKVRGNDKLQAKGNADQTKGNLKQAGEMNRPGFPGDSKPWKGWSHGEQDNLEAVSA
jgi:uncharacterized protein YjbJ (UPF0337 family)